MGLFDKFKKKTDNGQDGENTTIHVLIDMLSRYIGPARQRQLAFGDLVVKNRNWNVDLSSGIISFGEDEYPVQLLGTESDSEGTWLWGFLNQSGFPEAVLKASEYAYNFFKPVDELATAEPVLTELVNGHYIASIAAASRNDSVCYYRCPYDGGSAFVLVGNIPEEVFAPVEAARVVGLISELITQLPLDHKILVRSMMEINCNETDEAENKLTGHYADGTALSVSFDDHGRIEAMNTTLSPDQNQTEADEAPDNADGNPANITIYTVIGDFSRVKKALTEKFADMTKEIRDIKSTESGMEVFVITFHDNTEIEFHINTNQELVGQHITGMYNFFAQVKCENQRLHESVLRQIRVFNCVVGSSFKTNNSESRTNYIINAMFAAAKDITGIVLTPDMRLFSHDGELIFSTKGESYFEEYIPIGNADFLDSGADETASDTARRERSIAILTKKGIPYIAHLRSAVTESEASLRSPQEIALRLFAMFATCVYSEARNSGDTWEEAQKYPDRINEIIGGRLGSALSPEEKQFLEDREPKRRELVRFSWRYECCHALMWAIGVFDDLGYPDKICDVSRIAKIIWRQESLEKLLESAKPRTKDEILDAADLLLRYDWACVDARIHKKESPAGLDGGVVQEWHYAFNWLIDADNNAKWDDISTNT